MALRGKIGALVLHSRRDPRETTAPARAAFLKRFERQVDPDGTGLAIARRYRLGRCVTAFLDAPNRQVVDLV